MADGLFTLLSLSIVMAVASFVAGILPLSLSLSQSQLRLISSIGMGVLVGTSMVVIIPEGVETLYSASQVGHSDVHVKRKLWTREADVRWYHHGGWEHTHPIVARVSADDPNPFNVPGPVLPPNMEPPPRTPTKPGTVGIMDTAVAGADKDTKTSKGGDDAGPHKESQHAWIGVALLAGFMLMFLIDKLPQYTHTSKPKARTHHIALNNLGRRFNLTTSLDRDDEADAFLESPEGSHARSKSFATTIGLVIHAAADGIALGASSTATNSGLSFVIFFAIMVHKAPAAFGLTSVLVKQGLSRRAARGHLVIFSLAAPAGALLTWMLAHALGGGRSRSAESTAWWTGMLLLFSAGTFLYVAMHSMHETFNSPTEATPPQPNGYADGRDAPQSATTPSWRDLGAACFGMILPLFLQVGHAH